MTHVTRSAAIAAAGFTILSRAAALAEVAPAPPAVDTGDTAWVLTASALVLMMTLPGLALFYGGLVRAKNVLNVLMQCFSRPASSACCGSWSATAWRSAPATRSIGDLSKVGLAGVTLDSVTANFATPPRNIPEYVFVMFQAMFAIITPALILGAIAERMKFSVWVRVHHDLAPRRLLPDRAHGVGRPRAGSSSRARSTSPAAWWCTCRAASRRIVAAIMLGKRRGFGKDPMPPHSLPLCLIGAGLLWTGWFGFNAGSALSASPLADAGVPQHQHGGLDGGRRVGADRVAAPRQADGARRRDRGGRRPGRDHAGVRQRRRRWARSRSASASRSSRTRACTFLKPALGYDDSLDVFGVHALGGAWGALASGIFAVTLGSGIESNAQQIMVQLKGIAFVAVFAPLATVVDPDACCSSSSARCGSSEEEEIEGLDLSQHSESAYGVAAGGGVPEGVPSGALGLGVVERHGNLA